MKKKDESKNSYLAYNYPNVRLISPVYTLWKEMKYSLEYDSKVHVMDLVENDSYLVKIVVDNQRKGEALATILMSQFQLGNIVINVNVQSSSGNVYNDKTVNNVEELNSLVKEAFTDNILFVDVVARKFFNLAQVFLIFSPSIIQFFNDDLSDLYGNYNEVTAKVFQNIVKEKVNNFRILCSTALINNNN